MNEGTPVVEAAIVKSEPSHLPQRAVLSRELLKVESEQRALLGAYVKQQMVEGTDYGKIPGTDKPTLLKPGAEKLLGLFHCSPEYELVRDQCTQDFERGFFKYTFRVAIRGPGGALLAEGYGSANSRESRYRWRDARRKCPACGHAEALLKSKKEPGFFCWDKKGGCGATFGPDDKRITEQVVGKVENPDIADLDNTILKMAKKRALVDASIALARCSDMFTQDLDDLPGDDVPAGAAAPPAGNPAGETRSLRQAQAVQSSAEQKPQGKPAARRSLEDARKVDRSKELVGFGEHKSVAISTLTHAQLGEALDEGEAWVKANPGYWNLNKMRNQIDLLMLEYRARENAASSPPSDDVPF